MFNNPISTKAEAVTFQPPWTSLSLEMCRVPGSTVTLNLAHLSPFLAPRFPYVRQRLQLDLLCLFQMIQPVYIKHDSQLSSVQFSHLVMFNSLRPHETQHARPPCLSPTPGVD